MTIDVSLLSSDDTETLDGVVFLNRIFTQESGTYSKMSVNQDKFREFVIEYAKSGYCITAKSDGMIVGYALAFLDTRVTDKISFEISTMYVDPAYRNSGVGAVLVEKLNEIMDRSGAVIGQVSICAEINDAVQRATELLFQRKGYEQIGTVFARKGF